MTFGSLQDPALLSPQPPSGDAEAPDNDAMWKSPDRAKDAGLDPGARREALITQCEQRVDRAWASSSTRSLAAEIEANSCTALKGGRKCVKCRMCPTEGEWREVNAYYRGQKSKIFVCAEKNLSQEEVETSLQHQLVVAYDHCRQGMRVPFTGIQAPWALSCAATACSEVRAYLRDSLRVYGGGGGLESPFGGGSFDGGGGFGGGGFGSYGDAGMSGGGGGSGSSGAFLTDGNLSGDGSLAGGGGDGNSFGGAGDGSLAGGGGNFGGGPASAVAADPERVREAIYSAAYNSLSHWGACRGREPRAVLDAVFNACMADEAPKGRKDPNGGPFPPYPPAVAEADKAVPAVPAPPTPSAPTVSSGTGDEQHRARVGEV